MIIDKVQAYWTEGEKKDLYNIRIEQNNIIEIVGAEHAKEAPDLSIGEERLEKYHSLEEDAQKIVRAVENRYIKDRKPKGLLEDLKEIVGAITKEDYLAYTKEKLAQIATLKKEGMAEESLATLRALAIESYNNCYNFILYHLRVQINGLAEKLEDTDKAIAIVEKKVSLWYVKPQPTHRPIPYSKPTDALANMSQKYANINEISGEATIDRFSVQLRIEKFKERQATLGISTDKLLSTALAEFAQHNDFSRNNKTASNRRVVIPLREYASLLGYDVEEHETSTPEEAEKEKKRAKNQLDNARKKVKKDLDLLYNISFEWEEVIRGKVESFSSIRLLSAKEYKGGNFSMTFTPEIADHLVSRGLITQYNTGLLGVDERYPNAYRIMKKLEEHYNMDANQTNNRHDRIGIETLLKVTDLPSYEEVQAKDRGHWIDRIKEPLENNLDYLTKEHLLEDWEYTHAKGVPLTEEEASTITDYLTFSNLYLRFTPADRIDHTERQERRKAEREAKKKPRNTKQ